MGEGFFNGVLLDVRKNSADLSNLNTRVEEIATRVTTNELVLVNNKVVKIAMTRAIQKLVCTGFANWVLVDSWASLRRRRSATSQPPTSPHSCSRSSPLAPTSYF